MLSEILTGLFFIGLGAAFAVAAAFAYLHTRRFADRAASVFGEVVRLQERHDDGVTYSPVIRFSTPTGRSFEFTETTSSNPPGYGVGDRIRILYDPLKPGDARVASPFRLYLLAIIFGCIGATLFAAGVVVAALTVF